MTATFLPTVEEKIVTTTQSFLCPPCSGTILAVKMPCGREALARVLRNVYPSAWCGYRPSQAIGLRVEWLPAQREYMHGYKIVWDQIHSGPIESYLPWPSNSSHICYGTFQLGEYREIE